MAETVSHVKGYGSKDVGRREDRVGRSLVTAGIACLTLMVVALIAAISGGAREDTSHRPSITLQMLAKKQLQILEQTEAEKEAARKFLQGSTYDFTMGDTIVPASDGMGKETVVKKANAEQSLHQMSQTLEAAHRLAEKSEKLSRHLQAHSTIHLGLGDDVVKVGDVGQYNAAVPFSQKIRVDPFGDQIIKRDYQVGGVYYLRG